MPGRPSASYDPNGAIFAVCFSTKNTIQLYDMRHYDKVRSLSSLLVMSVIGCAQAPFLAVNVEDSVLYRTGQGHRPPVPTSCRFSNDGKRILLGTAGNVHYIVDSFKCTIQARLEGA